MSKIALTPSATGTGTFTISSPATNTDRTLVLPDEAGTVLTTATAGVPVNGPAFSAYANVTTSVSSGVYTKVLFQVEEYDTNNDFNSSRFTPTVAGYYNLNWGVGFASSSYSGRFIPVVYKNNTIIYYAATNVGATQYGGGASAMYYANGSTDYFEVYVYQDTGLSKNTDTRPTYDNIATYFQGYMVRSAT